MAAKSSIYAALDTHIEKARQTFGAITGACFVVLLVRIGLELASSVHLIVGGAVAALLGGVGIWLILLVKRSSRYADRTGVIGTLVLGALTVTTVCAWVSFTLHVNRPETYSVSGPFSAGTFMDYYVLVFLDLLPGLEILKTLKVEQRIQALDFWAGVPVLTFKIVMLLLVFDAFKSWWKGSGERDAGASKDPG